MSSIYSAPEKRILLRKDKIYQSKALRTVFGIVLLAAVIIWVAKEGILFSRISFGLLLCSTFAALTINFLNASIIKVMVEVFKRDISYIDALHISALGTFGNSAGGLPIGTTLKYVILYKQSGLKIKETTTGLIIFTIAISLFLLGYAAISVWGMNLARTSKMIPSLLLAASTLVLVVLWKWLRKKNMGRQLIQPFLDSRIFRRITLISFVTATLFILNYLVISLILFPEIPLASVVFIASIGLLTGLASLLQTVGGIHEFSMGISAFIAGIKLIDGMQLALSMRVASLLSSGMILVVFYFSPHVTKKLS